jgi:uncharacterized damage-inducible protein DinB
MEIAQNFKEDAFSSFTTYKRLAERAIEQVTDEQFFHQIDAGSNSIAVMVKHIAGNLRSRWTDFLTTDGEKPDRHRDTEFELNEDSRASLMSYWSSAWQTLFDAIEPLTPADLSRTVIIRGEPHTVVEAINRQLTHYSYHIGQIVFLAKHLRSTTWKSLSVPKGKTEEFNQFVAESLARGIRFESSVEASAAFGELEKQKSEPK